MLALEWRLTIIGVLVLPLFILAARRLSTRLRDIARETDGIQRPDERHDERNAEHQRRAAGQAVRAQHAGSWLASKIAPPKCATWAIQRAVLGMLFFVHHRPGQRDRHSAGLLGRRPSGHAWRIHHRHDCRLWLVSGAVCTARCKTSTNAPVDFATSMVSFERVFEVIDLPLDIDEKPDAMELDDVRGELVFEDVSLQVRTARRKLC